MSAQRAAAGHALRSGAAAALALAVGLALAPGAAAAERVPTALSGERAPVPIGSNHGSGVFGRWDAHLGLASYLYELDHRSDPRAQQPELNGNRNAWHQLGNDHIVANAYNRGHVRLWSQDRIYQWVNLEEPAEQQHAGGYGYLRVGDRTISTLWDDLPPETGATRRFGTGYFERLTPTRPVSVRERVYAPYGDDPILLHDVVLRNHTDAPLDATWFEYWGVNPVQQLPALRVHRGLQEPRWDAGSRMLTVAQRDPQDERPLSIYAAALDAPVDGFETDADAFFGEGGRADPEAVRAGRAGDSIAAAVPFGTAGRTMMAFRSPVTIPAGGTVRLRYAYGAAQPTAIPGLVARWRDARGPFGVTVQAWRDWLPQISFGAGRRWLSRELQWDAYMLRSGTSYEEGCDGGRHIISQGGFYQYSLGFQGAYRDPLQHVLPMIYMEPWIARDVLRYSAAQQPRVLGLIPYATLGLCRRFDFGSSNDLDLWLLLAAAEYGLATRDLAFFDERVPYSDAGDATLWEHLKDAVRHQESQRGPNGGYLTGATGDWSDFATQLIPMTESILVTAQAAYIYPRLAELADARDDVAFARELRATTAGLREELADEWVDRGWYARAYLGAQQRGTGVIYGEPQPWALLSGVPSAEQATTLVRNIRRFLTGVDAPPQLRGPARIGSSMSPSRDDPEVAERLPVGVGVGSSNAVYPGGAWYAINGWLTWALAELDGTVPNAREYAFDEFLRNTLATHANEFPAHWNGTISVDDACRSHFDAEPHRCGVGLSTTYDGQIMHQPAWSLFDAIRLAGIEPTARGYRIEPHLPLERYRLSLQTVGIAVEPGRLRGYLRPEKAGDIELEVRLPAGARPARAFVDGRRAAARREGDVLRLTLPARAGEASDWAVTYRGAR